MFELKYANKKTLRLSYMDVNVIDKLDCVFSKYPAIIRGGYIERHRGCDGMKDAPIGYVYRSWEHSISIPKLIRADGAMERIRRTSGTTKEVAQMCDYLYQLAYKGEIK